MKPTHQILIAVAFLVTFGGVSATVGQSNKSANEPQPEKIDALFAPWNKPVSPGCALAVIRDGQLLYKRGYGMANLDHDIPISSKTVFYIASMSKQITALSVALLAREGKVSLDDDIHKYLPEMPQYAAPVTIRRLIYHTSGIREYSHLMQLAGTRLTSSQEG